MNLPTMPTLVRTLQRRRLSVTLAALAATGIALTGCSAGLQTTPSQASPSQSTSTPSTDTGSGAVAQELLAVHGLAGLDVREVIARLEATAIVDRPDDLLASVQPDTLVLRDAAGREGRLPLPDDAVYVSIAPFRDQTHECHFHSLTTCVGELPDTEVRVTLTTDDGSLVVDETRRTQDNGFVGVWVPRGLETTLTVESQGLIGSVPLSTTSPDDRTCITDLQLR
ncbi:CueP family metal-binding protein [Microbacterium oxydans]|uniref:CueP family metal-binding protein n=1 Tax=Microbacterium oxydans TaxID=82380 RepID=UPI0024ADD0B2|nr:CueP family metal-binding protein [Microbacterium oxydans]